MKLDIEKILKNDAKLIQYPGIKLIIDAILVEEPNLLYFLSPYVRLKSKIIRSVTQDIKHVFSKQVLFKLKLFSLNFSEEEIDLNNLYMIDEQALLNIFAHYAKFKKIPNKVLTLLQSEIDNKQEDSKTIFYINLFLAKYFYDGKSSNPPEKHLKYCIEFISNNDVSNYDKMITLVICADYSSENHSVFVNDASTYYKSAEKLAKKLNDEMTLAYIYNGACLYHLFYRNSKNKVIALKYGLKALEIEEGLNQNTILFQTYKNLGANYLDLGEYNKASHYLEKAAKISLNTEEFSPLETAKLQNSLGYLLYVYGSFGESLKFHLYALRELAKVDNVSDLLDESIKTFANLSMLYRSLGNMNESIYLAETASTIINNVTLKKSTSHIYNLYKQYTDMGILHGIYLDNFHKAKELYERSKEHITMDEDYIRRGSLKILEAYINFKNGKIDISKNCFDEAHNIFLEQNYNDTYVQTLLIPFNVYFSLAYEDISLLNKAEKIAEKYSMMEHFYVAKRYFIDKKPFEVVNFKKEDYPINLIILLSKERKYSLLEGKKSNDYELIQQFSNKINTVPTEIDLYKTTLEIFNKYFLAKGFAAVRYNFNDGFSTIVTNTNDYEDFTESAKNEIENLIEKNNLFFNHRYKDYDIYSDKKYQFTFTKSMILFYIYDEITGNNYYYAFYNDNKCDWCFSKEDAQTGLILIKSLYLKLKNIQYTESIKNRTLTDPLTGLFNSKYLWQKLDDYIEQYTNTRTVFSMAVIDINNFKGINDNFGHTAGDEAIKVFAQILKMALVPYNEIIRYGGDEFLIIFPSLNRNEAESYIYKIKDVCSSHIINFNKHKFSLNFSYGLDEIKDDYANSKFFFEQVDKLMYKDKELSKRFSKISANQSS
ncbi:MAG: diguanylate cyclase [Bacillota bacterium]|nr:diguanylate cyclase [Bacillota bacterium]